MSYSDNAYIYLRKKILDWEWYSNVGIRSVFIHCLLKASWCDTSFQGVKFGRGQLIETNEEFAKELGISVQTVKTSLDHLKKSGELTFVKSRGRRIITVVKYDYYQQTNLGSTCESALDQPQTNLESTSFNKDKEIKERKERKNNKPSISPFEELEKTDLSENIKVCLREWFEYKKQRKEKSYQTEMGFKKFITQVRGAVSDHGEEKVIKQFDYAMSRGWSGAYLDKIQGEVKSKPDNDFTLEDILKQLGEDGE